MTIDQLKEKLLPAIEAKDYEAVDATMFAWLKAAAPDYGRDGVTAQKLLELAQELMQ